MYDILVAPEKDCIFEPRDRDLHAGIFGCSVTPEIAVEIFLDDLAGCRDDFAIPFQPRPETPQGLQDRGDFQLVEARPGCQ